MVSPDALLGEGKRHDGVHIPRRNQGLPEIRLRFPQARRDGPAGISSRPACLFP
jgi:hypothetical protein